MVYYGTENFIYLIFISLKHNYSKTYYYCIAHKGDPIMEKQLPQCQQIQMTILLT